MWERDGEQREQGEGRIPKENHVNAGPIVAGAALVGISAFTVALLRASRRWIVPPRVVIDPPGVDELEEAHFTSADGTPLFGLLLPRGEPAPAVMLLHGYQRGIEETQSLGAQLHARGFTVFVFDFRACGRSGGRFTTIGRREPEDAAAALAWLCERLGPDAPVGVLGISMGGAVALDLAAADSRVRAVVTDSAFATLMAAVRRRFAGLPRPVLPLYYLSMWAAEAQCRARVRDVRPVEAARRLRGTPVLLIHATADEVVPYSEALALAGALDAPHCLWTIPGGQHAETRFERPSEYLDRVSGFFHRHLTQPLRSAREATGTPSQT